MPIRIATRASELALRQARLVQQMLERLGHESELVTFRTQGDRKLDQPLSGIGAKGLFTRELEDALAAGKVDCCVHSLKDLPTEQPDGLVVGAVLPREDPRDVLVVNDVIDAEGLADLPRGSRVGTSSLRRRAQLLATRGDLDIVDLRGNVPTRLRKVADGQVHAAVLAAAGLHRLEAHQRITAYLDPPHWLPAPGQGAIAVQLREDDEVQRRLFDGVNHEPTMIATRAERALLAALGGGCQVPIGALALEREGSWTMYAMIADLYGRRVVRGERAIDPAGPEPGAEALAAELASHGGSEIMASLRQLEKVPAPQPE